MAITSAQKASLRRSPDAVPANNPTIVNKSEQKVRSAGIQSSWDLLAEPNVQRDLRLSPAQIQQVASIMNCSEAEVDRRLKERPMIAARAISRRGMILEIARPDLVKLGETLSEQQKWRMQQITVQQWGPRLLECPGIVELLGVSPKTQRVISLAQDTVLKEESTRIIAYAKRHHVQMVNTKGGKVPADTPAILHLKKQRDAVLWTVVFRALTKVQASRLNKLLGASF